MKFEPKEVANFMPSFRKPKPCMTMQKKEPKRTHRYDTEADIRVELGLLHNPDLRVALSVKYSATMEKDPATGQFIVNFYERTEPVPDPPQLPRRRDVQDVSESE